MSFYAPWSTAAGPERSAPENRLLERKEGERSHESVRRAGRSDSSAVQLHLRPAQPDSPSTCGRTVRRTADRGTGRADSVICPADCGGQNPPRRACMSTAVHLRLPMEEKSSGPASPRGVLQARLASSACQGLCRASDTVRRLDPFQLRPQGGHRHDGLHTRSPV